VVTLNLTINYANAGTDVITACDSLTWIDGITYTASTNTPTFTLTNYLGCDSVVTLNLTINYANNGIQTTTVCNTYTWSANNTTYTLSGTYTATLINYLGCDSVVTLILTINANTGSQTNTACNSYTWSANNTTYTLSGTYTATLTNYLGCDSVVTLNLTINYANTGTDLITACDNYTWIDGITYTASTNTPIFTLTNYSGCDSTVTLNLTIKPSPTLSLIKADDKCGENTGSVRAIAGSDNPPITYLWNTGSTDSSVSNIPAGIYKVTINDASGCAKTDSVEVLDECLLFIPNVFTPNADSKNDLFVIKGLNGSGNILLIFNRWGSKIYENFDYKNNWDGTILNGIPASNGTYYYVFVTHKKQEFTGFFTLLR
jgi:gliding motility-associated-like protein